MFNVPEVEKVTKDLYQNHITSHRMKIHIIHLLMTVTMHHLNLINTTSLTTNMNSIIHHMIRMELHLMILMELHLMSLMLHLIIHMVLPLLMNRITSLLLIT